MKFKVLIALLLATVPTFVLAQKAPDQSLIDTDKTLFKIQRLNIIKYVTPLLLKKQQINDLLLTIEKCRAKELEIRKLDAAELKKVDPDLDKAIESALKDGTYPNRELQTKLIKLQEALLVRRRIATNEMVDMLFETCKKSLNEGQLTVMRNLVDPSYTEGTTKASKLPDEDKTKLFIKQIFLDGITYDILKELAKNVSE